MLLIEMTSFWFEFKHTIGSSSVSDYSGGQIIISTRNIGNIWRRKCVCKEIGIRHKYGGYADAFWKKKTQNYQHSWDSNPKPYAY